MRMLKQEDEHAEVEVSWEDQQRINTFSKLNTRHRNIEEKLDGLKLEKEALDDLSMELELVDEDESVMYRIGEAFIHMSQPKALKRLEQDLETVGKNISTSEEEAEECEKNMKELKLVLYAKFGSAINLDE